MMSAIERFSRVMILGACLFGGFCLSPVIYAGVNTADAAAAEKEQKVNGPHGQRYQIRCWQDGKLLFEEADWVLTPEQARQVVVKAKKQKGDASVMVLELRNNLCLLKQVH
jgi:hypothetical protein